MEVAKGHPQGLYVLFFSEMWERFSYYGMRALLVLYMTKELLFGDERAAGIYGSYTALVYATPFFGGMLADRLLGSRRAVILGGVLMALGHFAMASKDLLYLALALLIVGNGFFKPNISTIVGRLYPEGDARRDAGFTIFYMGINIGAGLSPIVCGIVGEVYGWHYGFALAGIGMIVGLVNFIWGGRRFHGHAEPPEPAALKEKVSLGTRDRKLTIPFLTQEWAVYLGALGAVAVAWWLVPHFKTVGYILNGFGVVVALALIIYLVSRCDAVERSRLIVALVLTGFSIVFWAFFEQAGSSITLFTDRNVDREVFSHVIPASVFQSVNPAFIILLAPLFSIMWRASAARSWEPSTPVKFGSGIVQLGVGFAALYYGAVTADNGVVALVWLVLGYFLHTTGELCLSPVGLSMITKLSPARIVGLMMGTWFLATAYAQYVAAIIARVMGIKEGGEEEVAGTLPPPSETVMVYGSVFGQIALVAIGVGVVLLLLSPLLRRAMRGIR